MLKRFPYRLLFAVLFVPSAWAQESPAGAPLGVSDDVLARQGDVVLTQGEIDAAFYRIPEIHRLAFVRSGEQVDNLIRSILQTKVVAAEAKKAGFDQNPLAARRVALTGEKELSDAWMEEVMQKMPPADYEAIAHEQYLAEPEQWMSREHVDVSHLLISSGSRSDAEALERIEELRREVVADPSRFDDLIMEYSEDPSKDQNQGRFTAMAGGQMVEPFEQAAFALEKPGDISQPVKTTYGYHLIRLNQKFPPRVLSFEQVKEQAVKKAEAEHRARYRANYLRKVLSDPVELPDGAVETMAKRWFGEDLELAPRFED